MATSEVDVKFLGQFAKNIEFDHPLLAAYLFKINGHLEMLSPLVIRARKLRRLDTTRDTKSTSLYHKITWHSREGLVLLEQYILPQINNFGELKVLAYKLRASYYHLYVLFHNVPNISLKAGQISTPPGLKSPRATKGNKSKAVNDRSLPPDDPFRPSSVQPTHPLEGGPVGGHSPTSAQFSANFLVPGIDYRPIADQHFQDAVVLAERLLWGSHPLRLSAKVEYCAFLYDCLHQKDQSRLLAKATIAEVYNAQEGMDDDMFEDAAEMVGILGKMMKRGLKPGSSTGTPGAGSSGTRATPPRKSAGGPQLSVQSPRMENPI